MTIKTLVENTAQSPEYRTCHGLSFYIETEKHKILFDLGPDDSFLRNADLLQVDISEVDTVIISHGHADHGGALGLFLERNAKAAVYAHKKAFEPHYSRYMSNERYIGLDESLKMHSRVVLLEDYHKIDDELSVFSTISGARLLPSGNGTLYAKTDAGLVPDDFSHEQSLLVTQNGATMLFAGCAHRGIVNILEEACRYAGDINRAASGFHMLNPTSGQSEPVEIIEKVAKELLGYDIYYYTCHCTGATAYDALKEAMGARIEYLSAGSMLKI